VATGTDYLLFYTDIMFKLISASDKCGEVKAEAFISISNIPDFKQNYKVIRFSYFC